MREMQALVQNYVLNRDRQMKYLAVLIALSLFVSFMVPFILMRPADSMAEASACGIEEHVHTEEAGCYQLFCTPEEGEEHVHSERCYGLICEKIVHTHTPNCYPNRPDFSALFSVFYNSENQNAMAPVETGYANSPKDKPSEYKAPAGSILGVATHFHIFAEAVSLQSHVHGNIATNALLQNGAFGVYNDRLNGMSSINYIRNLGQNGNLDNAYQTQLIMGHNYSSPPSPWFVNRYEIRDKKNHKTYYIPKDKFPAWGADGYVEPQLKFERPDRPYINITQELNKFAEMSMDLVEEAQNQNLNSAVTVTENGENLTLDFSNVNDKYIYYTIDATKFGMNSPWSTWMKVLQIKGITEDKFLFLNIDVGTNPDAYFSKSWMVYQNDNQNDTYGTGEVTLGEGGTRVIYNIVSSDGKGGNYKPFEGKAVFGERRNGSILAPNADVNVAGNTNGTIIARKFVATGESHRCDVQQEGTEGDDADWPLGDSTPTPPQPKKIEITVQKEWSGQQLGQVKVYLYKSTTPNLDVATANLGTPHKEATLSSGNSWQTVFTDLPAEEAGKTLYYYVKEETLNNYTATYDKNGLSGNNGTVKITNVEQVQNITVSVEKKWDHPDGSATPNITVKLYQSTDPNLDATKPEPFNKMTAYREATLNSGNWNVTFSGLPAKENGNTFYYYIVEQNVPENYTVSYTGNGVNSADGKVTVTNAKGKVVSVTAKKQWKPSVPSNAIPVKVKLYQSTDSGLDATKPEQFSGMKEIDSATLSASNNWTCKFDEYPAANAKGEMYYYYIVESTVQSGYSAIYTNNGLSFNDGEIVVTNVKDITVTAKKIWNPETVASTPTTQEPKTYKIMPIGDSITQGHGQFADGSTGETAGYRKYLDYILKQKYSIDMVGPNGSNSKTTTFTYNGQSIGSFDDNHAGWGAHQSYTDDGNGSVYHQLQNADNNGNPGSIKEAQPDIVLLMIGTNDRNAWPSPSADEFDQRLHKLLDYILAELPQDSVVFLASIFDFQHNYGDCSQVDVTKYNAIIKKVAQSYANSGKNVRFVDANKWLRLEEHFAIEKTGDGKEYRLHPNETGYEIMGKNWATVIDAYIQDTKAIEPVDAETREPINVKLYKSQYGNLDATNAEHVKNQMTHVQDAKLNSDNGWSCKFEGLPAMENGSTLYYYIVEENVPQYYTATYTNNAVNTNDGTVIVTNTKEKLMNITLDKTWVGEKPQNDSITVTLYQSTERNLDVTVSNAEFNSFVASNNDKIWEYKNGNSPEESRVTFKAGENPHFTNLPVYDENGKMYYYYVRENDVNGYQPSYSKNPVYGGDKEVTITNTKLINITVKKNWQDEYGNVQNINKQITVVLYKYKHIPAEGEMSYWPTTYMPAAATPLKSADGKDWTQQITGNDTVTFENLPVEEDGYKLFYYVMEIEQEDVIKEYDVIYDPNNSGQLVDYNQPGTDKKTIINKEKAETEISISVNKQWDVKDFFNDFNKNGTMDSPNEYYVQDSVNPPEQWADPIKVTLQRKTDSTDWTDYKEAEFYTDYTFTNLPKKDTANNPYYYRIVEESNYGYVTAYSANNNINADEVKKDDATPKIMLKNTLLKRTLNVKKNWYNNINDGIDKVVVEIYRRTSKFKPDNLGINDDGSVTIKGMFENGSNDGWMITSDSAIDTNKSKVVDKTDYNAANDAGPGAYALYNRELIEYRNASVLSQFVGGKTYPISAQVTRPNYSKIVVNFSDGSSTVILGKDKLGSSNDNEWAELSGTFEVPEGATVTSIQVGVDHEPGLGHPLYVDDIIVEAGDAAPETFTPVEVLKTTFEDNDTTKDGWKLYGNSIGDQNGTKVNSEIRDGGYESSKSFYLCCGDANDISYISYTLPVQPGATYSFTARSSRASKTVLKVGYGTSTPEEFACGTADEWQIIGEGKTFTVPEGVTSVTLQVSAIERMNWGSSIDDITVTQLTAGNSTENTYINSFDNNTTEGWTVVGKLTNGGNSGGLRTDVTYDGSSHSYGLLSDEGKGTVGTIDGKTYYYCSYIQKEFTDLTAGSVYNFSTKVTRTNNGSVYVALRASLDDGTPFEIARVQTTANKIDWKELAGNFTIPAGTQKVTLQIVPITDSGNMGTMLYVDDVEVNRVSAASNIFHHTFENNSNDGWTVIVPVENGVINANTGLATDTNKNSTVYQLYGLEMLQFADNNVLSKLTSGNTYSLSADVYRLKWSKMVIKFSDGKSTVIDGSDIDQNSDNTWTSISGIFTVPSGATVTNIQVGVDSDGGNNTTGGLGSPQKVDNITLMLVSNSGTTPATYSKPRNVETFFSGSNTLTKRKLNIQMLGSDKLAKATNDYKEIFVEFKLDDGKAGGDEIASLDDLAFMNGATFSHMEVHFRESSPGDFPGTTNIYFNGWYWGDFKQNSDSTIYTFKPQSNSYIFGEKSLVTELKQPEKLEKIILKATNGATLVINNVKFERTPVLNNASQRGEIALSNSGFTGAWYESKSDTLASIWPGQKISGIDVYFDQDAQVEQNDLQTDLDKMKASPNANTVIDKFGMYLMLNRGSAAWGGEFTAESVTVGTEWVSSSNTNMKVAKYTINTSDTWQGREDYSDGTNKSQIQSGKHNCIIFLTKMSEDIKAIVVRTEGGQTYELTNTVYPATMIQPTTSTEKWYPILNSYNDDANVGTYDILLTPNELYGEHEGKQIKEVKIFARKHTGFVDCQTYVNSTGYTGTNANKLTSTGWSNGVKTNPPNSNYENGGANIAKTIEKGDRLFFRAVPRYQNDEASAYYDTNPTAYIEKVVVYFENNTSYTIHNMNFVEYAPLNKGHYTDLTSINANLLETRDQQFKSQYTAADYGDKNLEYIVVNYDTAITNDPQCQFELTYYDYDGSKKLNPKTLSLTNGQSLGNGKIKYQLNSSVPEVNSVSKVKEVKITSVQGAEGIKDITMYFDKDETTYTLTNSMYSGIINYSHETSFDGANGGNLLNTDGTKYVGAYSAKKIDNVIVHYADGSFVSLPRDLIQLNGTAGTPSKKGESSMLHTYASSMSGITSLNIIEGKITLSDGTVVNDDFVLADIEKIVMTFADSDDDNKSTYTIYNTDYSPKAEPDTPAIGNQPALGSDFVFITTLDLTKENKWQAALDGLPVTDGQGNAYEYVIVEKNVYGEGADRYQLVSYEHPDGVILEEDGTKTSFLNTTKDKDKGLVIMPSSGGEGKTWFYVAGIALMLCGIAGCYGMKRWPRSRR